MPQSTIAQWLTGSRSIVNETSKPSSPPSPRLANNSDTFKIPVVSESTDKAAFAQVRSMRRRPSRDLPILPPNVTISWCTQEHIKSFRRLNALLLPIKYPDSFYKETLDDEVIASITRLALWTPSDALHNGNTVVDDPPTGDNGEGKVVAGIRCRMLASPPHKPTVNEPVLYISTIGTLAPFRQLSLASHLLEEIIQIADEEYGVSGMYAHVWEANEEAMEWYSKRGFTILAQEHGYYKKLAPKTDAWLIKRDIG